MTYSSWRTCAVLFRFRRIVKREIRTTMFVVREVRFAVTK